MTQSDLPELVDVAVNVELVPRTELVHLAIGDRAGLVLTRREARALARDLQRLTGGSGRPWSQPRPRAGAAATA